MATNDSANPTHGDQISQFCTKKKRQTLKSNNADPVTLLTKSNRLYSKMKNTNIYMVIANTFFMSKELLPSYFSTVSD